MEYNTKEEQLKSVQEQLANILRNLKIEKVLYANLKEVLKKRDQEITSLYGIINELMARGLN